MRNAMRDAEVGDDVFGEDPTVNRLERVGASLLGKDACLFVPTGTMANTIAVAMHCVLSGGMPGASAVCGAESHLFKHESGSASALFGVMLHPVRNVESDGTLCLDEVRRALQLGSRVHEPQPRLVALEQTHK